LYGEWSQAPKRSYVIWMGLLAGAAIGFRNYAVSWIGPLFLLMVFDDQKPWDAVLFGLVAGLTFSPWPIRNWAFTGNPFYPSSSWAGAASDPYHLAMAPHVTLHSFFATLLKVPFYVTGGTFIWDFGLIPFVLAPLAWARPNVSRQTKRLTFIAVAI